MILGANSRSWTSWSGSLASTSPATSTGARSTLTRGDGDLRPNPGGGGAARAGLRRRRTRLFVCRRDASERVLENEEELAGALSSGFSYGPLEGPCVRRQGASCSRRRRLIVGCHGAGLTNVGFAAVRARTVGGDHRGQPSHRARSASSAARAGLNHPLVLDQRRRGGAPERAGLHRRPRPSAGRLSAVYDKLRVRVWARGGSPRRRWDGVRPGRPHKSGGDGLRRGVLDRHRVGRRGLGRVGAAAVASALAAAASARPRGLG
jgi:hypothetical protein